MTVLNGRNSQRRFGWKSVARERLPGRYWWPGWLISGVLLQSWVENREHSFLRRLASIMAQPALYILEDPVDDHRIWVRMTVGKHRPLAFP